MRTDVVVIQIGMKDVEMEMDTFPTQVRGSRSRDDCQKGPKKPRDYGQTQKWAKVSLLGVERQDKRIRGLIGGRQRQGGSWWPTRPHTSAL